MPDMFEDRSSGLESPGFDAASVTPSDSTDLPVTSRALYVGTTGDLRVTTAAGSYPNPGSTWVRAWRHPSSCGHRNVPSELVIMLFSVIVNSPMRGGYLVVSMYSALRWSEHVSPVV